MASEKKIEFLVKQGFDRDIVNVFVNAGVDKNLLWFLGAHKKGAIKYLNSEEIKLVNKFLESSKNISNKDVSKLGFAEILEKAQAFEQNEQRKINNRIYTFSNGYYVSVLNEQDLREEGIIMANCVGTYQSRVGGGYLGLLAIKQPSGKSVAHIEILRNGLIGQNYAKANTQMNKDSWLMVLEFFENNSKNVDLSKLFGESYIVVNSNGYLSEVSLSIPTSVNVILQDGVKKLNQTDGFEVKRFMSFGKRGEAASKINSKLDVLAWIEEKKQEVLKAYEDLTSQIIATSASKLYLSDEIKEKIFGSKEGAYLLKGDEYNMSELDPRYGQEEKMAEMVEEEMLVDVAEDALEQAPVPAEMAEEPRRARRRPIVRVAVAAVREVEVGNEAPEDMIAPEEGGRDNYANGEDDAQNERMDEPVDRAQGIADGEALGEAPVNQEDIALVEDDNGNVYEVNVNDIEEADMGEDAGPEPIAGEGNEVEVERGEMIEGFMSRHFDQILRKAR